MLPKTNTHADDTAANVREHLKVALEPVQALWRIGGRAIEGCGAISCWWGKLRCMLAASIRRIVVRLKVGHGIACCAGIETSGFGGNRFSQYAIDCGR
jgi:hypothetical protein